MEGELIPKRKMGRKSKYRKEFLPLVEEAYRQGSLDCEIMAMMDISNETFYRWILDIPEFSEVVSRCKVKSEAVWVGTLKDKYIVNAEKPDFKAIQLIMQNAFGWKQDGAVIRFEAKETRVPLEKSADVLEFNNRVRKSLDHRDD